MTRSRKQPDRPKPRRLVVGGAIGLAIAVAVTIAVLASSEPGGEPIRRDPASVAAGAELYQTNCSVCHGVDLLGTTTGPPFLHQVYAPNHHADESFQRAVLVGVPSHHWPFGSMAPVPGLDRDEVARIIDFVRSQQEKAGILRDPSHP